MVDDSTYGDAGALPPGVMVAIETQDTQPTRRLTGARARAHWRTAVSAAFMGAPTPYVVAGWMAPKACPALTGPRDAGKALVTAFYKVLPLSSHAPSRAFNRMLC